MPKSHKRLLNLLEGVTNSSFPSFGLSFSGLSAVEGGVVDERNTVRGLFHKIEVPPRNLETIIPERFGELNNFAAGFGNKMASREINSKNLLGSAVAFGQGDLGNLAFNDWGELDRFVVLKSLVFNDNGIPRSRVPRGIQISRVSP